MFFADIDLWIYNTFFALTLSQEMYWAIYLPKRYGTFHFFVNFIYTQFFVIHDMFILLTISCLFVEHVATKELMSHSLFMKVRSFIFELLCFLILFLFKFHNIFFLQIHVFIDSYLVETLNVL
jgi:hypothetical protein